MAALTVLPIRNELFVYVPTIILAWITGLVIYRRYFHPLAAVPGPFIASITDLYVLKFNVFSQRSQLYLQIEKLHDKYGSSNLTITSVGGSASIETKLRADRSYQTQ